jgi:beta-aspartyl-peptidase (threonine type)
MNKCTIVIHGGAGVIDRTVDPAPYYKALGDIIASSAEFAQSTNGRVVTAVDVVEFAVKLLEDEPLFNAGVGAVLTADHTHELEASIMDGTTLKCGAASLIRTVRNPVSVARAVMQHTKHNYLIGNDAAERLAHKYGLECVDPSYFTTERRKYQLKVAKQHEAVFLDHSLPSSAGDSTPIVPQDLEPTLSDTQTIPQLPLDAQKVEPGGTGTVGCVCMLNGQVAAATSTGGLTNKLPGRVGDTPIAGAGNYAHHLTGKSKYDSMYLIVS